MKRTESCNYFSLTHLVYNLESKHWGIFRRSEREKFVGKRKKKKKNSDNCSSL